MNGRPILKVVTPAATYALTSLIHARAEVGLTDDSNDMRLGRLIKGASSTISAFCNRVFGVETVTETFRADTAGYRMVVPGVSPGLPRNEHPLLLSRPNIISVGSLLESGNALVQDTDFEVDTRSGIIYRLSSGLRYAWLAPLVVLTYTSGFKLPQDAASVSGPPLPDTVEDACLALVRAAWFAGGRDPSVAVDALNGDRTSFWDRSVGTMTLDEGLQLQLTPFRVFFG